MFLKITTIVFYVGLALFFFGVTHPVLLIAIAIAALVLAIVQFV